MDGWNSFEELTKDRNFLNLLSGMGSRFGEGQAAGTAIGIPTQQMIQSMAVQEATGKAEAERKKWNEKLFDLLSGGFTPKEQAGPTSLKVNPDNMVLDISTTSPVASVEGADAKAAALPAPAGRLGVGESQGIGDVGYSEIPKGGGMSNTGMTTPRFDLREVLGFWGTPSR